MNEPALRLFEQVRRGQLEPVLEHLVQLFGGMGQDLKLAGAPFPFPVYDELCADIGRASAFELLAGSGKPVQEEHDLVLITETTVQGGHVELIRDIADAGERKLLIVATNLYKRRQDVVLPALAEHDRVLDVVVLDEPELIEKVRQVQTAIANPAARRVIVMCHGDDAVAISAAAPVDDKPVLFFHHCDHSPCLGCYMPHAEHIDLHNIGFDSCRRVACMPVWSK